MNINCASAVSSAARNRRSRAGDEVEEGCVWDRFLSNLEGSMGDVHLEAEINKI